MVVVVGDDGGGSESDVVCAREWECSGGECSETRDGGGVGRDSPSLMKPATLEVAFRW